MTGTFDTLMAGSGDEPDALYGLVAKSVRISDDKLTYRFALRPEARFHDGSKLTAKDAAFSLNILKTKGHPVFSAPDADGVSRGGSDEILRVSSRRNAARHPSHRRQHADLLRALLAGQGFRGLDLGGTARLRRLQGRPRPRSGVSSSSSACLITGPRTFR